MVQFQWMTVIVYTTHALLMVFGIVVMAHTDDHFLTETLHGNCLTIQDHLQKVGYVACAIAVAGIVTYELGIQRGRSYLRIPYSIAAVCLIVFALQNTTKILTVHQEDMNEVDDFWLKLVEFYDDLAYQLHYTFLLDAFQKENACCGYNGYDEYPTLGKIPPPPECCKLMDDDCDPAVLIDIHTQGCRPFIRNFYEKSATKTAAYGFVAIFLGYLSLFSILLGPVFPNFQKLTCGFAFCRKKQEIVE